MTIDASVSAYLGEKERDLAGRPIQDLNPNLRKIREMRGTRDRNR